MPDTANETKSEDAVKLEKKKAADAALKYSYCLLTRGGLIGVIVTLLPGW
jgi:hypothetical protein